VSVCLYRPRADEHRPTENGTRAVVQDPPIVQPAGAVGLGVVDAEIVVGVLVAGGGVQTTQVALRTRTIEQDAEVVAPYARTRRKRQRR
jgi:hypothetical protein